MTRHKTPPYARLIVDMHRDKMKPDNTITIHLGKLAWHKCKAQEEGPNYHILLPPGEDPNAYQWPVNENDVIIMCWEWQDGPTIRDLTKKVLDSGASFVVVMNPDFTSTRFDQGDL